MSKFNNKYIKKSERDGLNEILNLIKNRKHFSALRTAVSFMDSDKRLIFVWELFQKSRYRAYFGGMQEFKQFIDQYLSTKDKGIVKFFISELEKRAKEDINYSVNSFYSIRISILYDVLQDKGEHTFQAILSLYNYDVLFGEEDYQELLPVTIDICRINWPDNPAIKVLFGKN